MDWKENMKLFSANIVDNYNAWAKPWLDNIDELSKKNVTELLKDEASINQANDSFQNIKDLYNSIDVEYKNRKIKSRKVANVFIIIFSCLIIGLFFLWFLFNNKKIMKEYDNFKNEQMKLIKDQNNLKKEAFLKLFSQVDKKDLLNSYLKDTGLCAINNVYGSQLEEYFHTLKDDCIGIHSFGVLKAGEQNIYICNICNEHWETVVTSASKSVPYTVMSRDSQGNISTQTNYDTVVAYHEENTPFRELETYNVIGFKKGICNPDVDWMMSPKENDVKKNKEPKFKKIASNQKEKIENSTIFENNEFNNEYQINIFDANGSFEQEQDVKTWFTIGTQEKFVQMYTDLQQKNKLNLIDFKLYKIDDALLLKSNQLVDCSWYVNNNVLDEVDTNPKISLQDNIFNVATKGKEIAINNMLATCQFLNFTKVNSLLLLNPISYDYALTDCDKQPNDDDQLLDSETIINYGNLTRAFASCINPPLVNNAKTVYVDKNKNLTIAVYEVTNYTTETLFDPIPVYAARAGVTVIVNVPYVRYFHYTSQSIGIGFKKRPDLDVDALIKKICNEIPTFKFNYFNNDSNYLFLYANDTNFNKESIDDLKIKLLSMLI